MAGDYRVSFVKWQLKRGESIKDTVIVKRIKSSEQYHPPALDDIVDNDRAILLEPDNGHLEPCFLRFDFAVTCFVHTATIITDCRKIETFVGKCEEYDETHFGELVEDFEGSSVYRFDLRFDERMTSQICIKILPKEPSLWIYGILIAVTPNLKALSASMLSPSINFENVQHILAASKNKLTPSAEKCKEFLKAYVTSKGNSNAIANPNLEMVMSMMNGNLLKDRFEQGQISVDSCSDRGGALSIDSQKPIASDDDKDLKGYIDLRLKEIETHIQLRIDELERRQNEKLDKILSLLDLRKDN